jgi:hypothetical protein
MAGDSGYEASEEDYRLMQVYDAARSAGQSQAEANRTVMQSAMEATYGAPQVSVDTSGLTGADPNRLGNPTIYYDASGNVAGVLSQNGVVTPASMNTILKPGETATASTPVQMVNEEGLRLYLRDANDPTSVTTTITGIPAISGTLGESAYRPVEQKGVFGTIGGDFLDMAKDPGFHKFLAMAAAIAGGGLALNSAYGVGGLGAELGATAFPIDMGGLSAGSSLGAPIGTGSLTAGITPASVAAFEAGLPTAIGSVAAPAATSGLASLFAGLGSNPLLQGGLALGGLAAARALAPKQGGSSGGAVPGGLSSEQLKAIVATMPSAMGNYLNMAGNPYGYGGGTIDSANANLANLFPGFSLPTAGPFYGAGRFGDAYAPQAASTTPISPTGLV